MRLDALYGMSIVHDDMFPRYFHDRSSATVKCHWEKTRETVASLKRKYEKSVIGKVSMLNLLNLLARCIDPGDAIHGNVNQLTHALLIAEEMEKDGINNPDLLIAAFVHDLGKIAFCINAPIGDSEKGTGLENRIVQWTHGEFIYSRLKDYLPDHISWLIRYHSFIISDTEPFLNERDRTYLERYQRLFRKYDQRAQSAYKLPIKKVEDYHELINRYFPEPILF